MIAATPSKRTAKSRNRGRENDARCHHFTRTGRRCRLPSVGRLAFCRLHAYKDRDFVAAALGRSLRRGTPRSILDARRKLVRYIVQRRIDASRAPVLLHLCDLLLATARRSQPKIPAQPRAILVVDPAPGN